MVDARAEARMDLLFLAPSGDGNRHVRAILAYLES